MLLLSTCCVLLAVIPTIEKLLNADWKEKLLDKSTAVAGQLKGQLLLQFKPLLTVVISCPFRGSFLSIGSGSADHCVELSSVD